MKLEGLRGQRLDTFAESMRRERLRGDAFRGLLEENLAFGRWGFGLGHTDYSVRGSTSTLICDSDRCRVLFNLSNIGEPQEDELYVRYGRLHAPNDDAEMIWRGERCRCWHYPTLEVLPFLEGWSVEEVFRHRMEEGEIPRPAFLADYRQSEDGRQLWRMYPPAAVIREERLIWDHYGDRLFDLFDLRRPELWEEYRRFVHDYWAEHERLFPSPPILGDQPLPRDKIC